MTSNLNQRRLLALYYGATPQQLQDGEQWYENALQFCYKTSIQTGYTVRDVTAVVAVISPLLGWGANKDSAFTLCEYHSRGASYDEAIADPLVRGFRTNLEKAWRILEGESPDDVVKGPKVTAFWRNLRQDYSVCTLDTHAMNAWAGHCERSHWPAKTREAMMNDYEEASLIAGTTIAQFQAVVWVSWRDSIMSEGRVRQYDSSVIDTAV